MKEELIKFSNCDDSFEKYIHLFAFISAPCFGFKDTEPWTAVHTWICSAPNSSKTANIMQLKGLWTVRQCNIKTRAAPSPHALNLLYSALWLGGWFGWAFLQLNTTEANIAQPVKPETQLDLYC